NKIKEENGETNDVYKMLEEWSITNPDKISGETLDTEIEKEKTFKVTSEGGEKKTGIAHGMITVFNDQGVAQDLIKKTRFKSDNGAVFRIKEAIKVPAKGKTEIEVFADEEGEAGNVGAGRFILPGFTSEAKRKVVYAESYEAMSGGVVYEKMLTQEDINTANDEMQEMLYSEAILMLDANLKEIMGGTRLPVDAGSEEGDENAEEGSGEEEAAQDNETLARDLINDYDKILTNAIAKEVLEVSITPEIGTKTEEFKLKMKLRVTAVLFDTDNLLTLAKIKLKNQLSDNYELSAIDEESLTYSVKKYDADLGMATLAVSLTGNGYIKSGDLINKFNLASLEPETIEAYLDAHPEIANIEIKEAPVWVRKLPILKNRIRVEIRLPE
ncbi:hypothetical protein HQ544_02105, partial [Candidatus Falkowbacteria bacterium]|nr:hypothetical protein [Candidatus Falkowbacteria bacterium]